MAKNYRVLEVFDCGKAVQLFAGSYKQCSEFLTKKEEEFPHKEYSIDRVHHNKLKL